jgi:hypothetical protein
MNGKESDFASILCEFRLDQLLFSCSSLPCPLPHPIRRLMASSSTADSAIIAATTSSPLA